MRIKPKDGERGDPWILFKKRDAYARPKQDYDVVRALPDSVGPAPRAGAGQQAAAQAQRSACARPPACRCPRPPCRPQVPATLAPQLATQASGLPAHGQWIFEIKFDGYRMLARFDGAKPRLFTRNGHDWSAKMPVLIDELAALKLKGTWLDGEVVVLGADGLPDFNALQNAFDGKRTREIRYFVFDVPYFEGHDLRAAPLVERRALLEAFVAQHGSEHVRFSAAFDADPVNLMRSAEQLKLEGMMAKRADAPYVSRRTDTWLKLKGKQRQEFVIGGFTDRTGDADAQRDRQPAARRVRRERQAAFGGQRRHRLVGRHRARAEGQAASSSRPRLAVRAARSQPAASAAGPNAPACADRWVKPQLVADVSFGDWTPDGSIRHAIFIGLRERQARQAGEARGRRDAGRRDAAQARRAKAHRRSRTPSA